MSTPPRTVLILIFPDVEVLDFAGPYEVFSVVGGETGPDRPFRVHTVSATPGVFGARNGLKVMADFSLADAPQPDILIIPGGSGSRIAQNDESLLAWIRAVAPRTSILLTVCTGVRILLRAGLAGTFDLTTHHAALDEIRAAAPANHVRADARVIDHGRLIISAGVASGIDASFHIVRRLCGDAVARAAAHHIEYPWPRLVPPQSPHLSEMNGYFIHRAAPEDVPRLAPLFTAYRGFYAQPEQSAGDAAFLHERLRIGESVVLYAVDHTGAVAGFTQLYPVFSSVRRVSDWILNDLYVDQAHRRAGVGRQLLRAARQFAAALGAGRLSLRTAVDNLPAQRLYESEGWRRDERFLTYQIDVPAPPAGP